jgi:hypothetical protein
MKAYVLSGALAMLCAGSLVLAQQPDETPNQTPPPATTQPETVPPAPGTQADAPQAQEVGMTTLTGCLYNEQDVPGREPNIAERAGILEDYILAVDMPEAEPGATEAVGTAGAGDAVSMYKVEHVDDNRLQELVGKRVEVTGRIDVDAGDTAAVGTAGAADFGQPGQYDQPDQAQQPQPDQNVLSPDAIELPEFEVVSIREVSGTCPPQPAAR